MAVSYGENGTSVSSHSGQVAVRTSFLSIRSIPLERDRHTPYLFLILRGYDDAGTGKRATGVTRQNII